ncbi:hypothetical protein BTH41_00716 [Bacillus mycoides]|nr:hypothetical protein BTH41_00716 [Bacillus mycoides]
MCRDARLFYLKIGVKTPLQDLKERSDESLHGIYFKEK